MFKNIAFFKIKFLIILFFINFKINAQTALTEQEAVEKALNGHPALEAAALRLAEQQALAATAKTWEPTEFFHNTTADPELGLFGTVAIGASQVFPSGKMVKARREWYRRQEEYAGSGQQLARRHVVRQVREIYRHLGYLGDKVVLYRQLDSLYSRIAGIAAVRYTSGDAALAEQLALQDRAGQVRKALETIGHEIAFDELVLGQLLGASGPVKTIAEPLRQQSFSLADTARLVMASTALHSAQAVAVAQAQSQVTDARSNPVFGGGLYGQYLANGLIYPGWQLSLQVPLDRRSLTASRQAARLAVDAAEANYRHTLLEQRTELAHLLHEQEKYEIELQYYESRGRQLAAELLKFATANYQAGELDYWELTQQLQQALDIELSRLDNLYGLNLTILELQALLD